MLQVFNAITLVSYTHLGLPTKRPDRLPDPPSLLRDGCKAGRSLS